MVCPRRPLELPTHDAAMRCVCAQVAAAACSAVLANYPRRDRGDHVRSTAAKRKRRRSKAPTGVAGAAQVAGAATASDTARNARIR